jgi:hypothetical protein
VRSPALQWLLDREALRQLMVDYFCGVDARDFERVAACFTPDVRADYGRLYSSRESLIEFIRGVRFFRTTLHCMGGQLFDVAGDEARMVTWAMIAHHGRKDDGEAIEYHNSGSRYVDMLTRKGGRWLVRERGGAPAWTAVGAPAPDTDDPTLRWLVDRARVRDLLVQWALGMDERDEARVGACVAADFREDGAVDAETFVSRAKTPRRLHSTTHFLGVPAIDLMGDSAIVESSGLVTERELGEPGKHPVLGLPVREERTRSAHWRDRLVRKNDRWWLAARGAQVQTTVVCAAVPGATTDPATRDLVDRELIRDVIARSALALDREDGTTNHLVGNQEIDIRGDEARVCSYVYRTLREDGRETHWGNDPRHWVDRLERRNGGWQIAERRDVDLLAIP